MCPVWLHTLANIAFDSSKVKSVTNTVPGSLEAGTKSAPEWTDVIVLLYI